MAKKIRVYAGFLKSWRQHLAPVALMLLLAVTLSLILSAQFLPSRYDLREGQVSPYDIKSPAHVEFISQIRTREAQDAAEAAVPDSMDFDRKLAWQQHQRAVDGLRAISDIRRNTGMSLQQRIDAIKQVPDLNLSPDITNDVLTFSDTEWQLVQSETLRVLDMLMMTEFSSKNLDSVRASIRDKFNPDMTLRQQRAADELVRVWVLPNLTLNADKTAALRKQARANVTPVRIIVEQGEMILRNGDIVKASDLEKLEAAGLRNPTIKWTDILGVALLSGMLVLLLSAYLAGFQSAIWFNYRRMLLLCFVIIIALLAAKLVLPGRDLYVYIFPTAAVAMLIGALLDTYLGLIVTTLLALLMGMVSANLTNASSIEVVALTMIGGGLAALGVRRMQRLSAFFTIGLGVGLANFVVIAAFHLQEQDYSKMALYFGLSMLNGVLCALLTMSTFYLLSHLFSITTTLQLLELLDPTQPLMQRLMTEAPGTYHHSMVVANLAERAAQMTDSNPLLARVSAYYHDIGKLTRPYFFIENQIDRRNLHDELDPYTSAQIIIGHVTDGLALAKEHRLPPRVRDVIAQHHGTHLVQYFHTKAQQQANGQPVDQACFRYPGPIPQTREAAIVMLADSVEATVRASRDHSAEAIDAIVRKITGERIAAGQLDGCDLTMRDMEQIRVAFTSMLQGIFHPRIEYPQTGDPATAPAQPVAPVSAETNLAVDLEYPQVHIEV